MKSMVASLLLLSSTLALATECPSQYCFDIGKGTWYCTSNSDEYLKMLDKSFFKRPDKGKGGKGKRSTPIVKPKTFWSF